MDLNISANKCMKAFKSYFVYNAWKTKPFKNTKSGKMLYLIDIKDIFIKYVYFFSGNAYILSVSDINTVRRINIHACSFLGILICVNLLEIFFFLFFLF